MLFKILKELVLVILKFFSYAFKKTINNIDNKLYSNNFIIYGIILFFLTLTTSNNDFILFILLKWIICIFVILLLIYSAYKIYINKKYDKLAFYYNASNLSLAIFFYSFFIFLLLNLNNLFNFVPSFILIFIYFKSRFLLMNLVRHFFLYTILFLLTPALVSLLWGLTNMIIGSWTKNLLFISNNSSWWIIMILSIVIMNLTILWTEDSLIDEVKVAVYLLLAIFSTTSYCFFISDLIANNVISYLKQYPELSYITIGSLKTKIDEFTKWITLPYLVGSVFGCFMIELVQRNLNKKKINSST